MQIDYPLRVDHLCRTALTDEDEHLRDMIEQFLLTDPGERVNRPDFGAGLRHMIFEPNSEELAAVLRLRVEAGLQKWLGDLVDIRGVQLVQEDSTLSILVPFVSRRTGRSQSVTVTGGRT